ncbi:hypothetical protein C2G38_2289426 [Gigaspora rosea]|uniref:Uncharacterized protein n=1 Tax=Gigaspora rosea TaxID=44941 RepID=A0A397U1Q8_9GLOM|nr:hypothetical protein C2G38_2289426 [Gigaspora rosea]
MYKRLYLNEPISNTTSRSEQEDITTYKVLECGQINLTLSNHKMTLTVQNIKPTVGTTTTKSQGSTHDQTEMDIDTDIPIPEPYQEQTENDMQIDRPEIDRDNTKLPKQNLGISEVYNKQQTNSNKQNRATYSSIVAAKPAIRRTQNTYE